MKLFQKFLFLTVLLFMAAPSISAQTFDPQKRQIWGEWQGLVQGTPADLLIWNPDVKDYGADFALIELIYHAGARYAGKVNLKNKRTLENIRLEAVKGSAVLIIGVLQLHTNNVNHLSGHIIIDEARHGALFQRKGYTDHFVHPDLSSRHPRPQFHSLAQLNGKWEGRINGNAARLVIYQGSNGTHIDLYDLKANRTFQVQRAQLPSVYEPYAVGSIGLNCLQNCGDFTMTDMFLHYLDANYLSCHFEYKGAAYSAYFKKIDDNPSIDNCGYSGSVIKDEKPLAGATLTFISEDGEVRVTVEADSKGSYNAYLPAGTYRVQVSHPEYGVHSEKRSYTVTCDGLNLADFYYRKQ